MKDTLCRAVGLLFRELPFSYQNQEFHEEILEAAFHKYEADKGEGSLDVQSAGNILIHSGNVEEICLYLGLEKADTAREPIVGESSFLKGWKRLRKNTYALSLELTGIIGTLLSAFSMGWIFSWEGLLAAIMYLLIFTVPLFLTIRKRRRLIDRGGFFQAPYEGTCRGPAERNYDFYSKKWINSIFLSFSLGFILVFAILLAVTTSKYTLRDVLHEVSFYLLFIEAVIYLLLKNMFLQNMAARFFCLRQRQAYRQELRRICAGAAGYYGVCLCMLFVLRNRIEN